MKLFFDTETTGLVNFGIPEDDDRQPRLVQLGMMLTTDQGRVVESHGMIVRPDGYEIPEVVANIHGINTQMAMEFGYTHKFVMSAFAELISKADEVIAHNIKFDMPVVKAELKRLGHILVERAPRFCTMLASTSICQIPKNKLSSAGGYKWPKLSEAYWFFFEEELKDAHDALTDVMACKRIYFEGLKQGAAAFVPEQDNIQTA